MIGASSFPLSCFNGRQQQQQQQQQQQRRALATLVYQVVPEAVLSFLYQVTPTGGDAGRYLRWVG
jgi:hypothetical protein